MKKYSALILVTILTFFITQFNLESSAAEGEITPGGSGFNIARLVIAGSVEDLEPVGAVNAFSSSTEKVYCFLEAKDIVEDTEIALLWYHEGTNKAVVKLTLRKGSRWRTYSSKKLGGLTGAWTVELQANDGNVLETVAFTVE